MAVSLNTTLHQPYLSPSCSIKLYSGLKPQSASFLANGYQNLNKEFYGRVHKSLQSGTGKASRSRPHDKPVVSLHLQDNDHVRSRDVEQNCLRDFSSSSKASTGGWLRTGVDVVDFSSNNNNTNRSSFSNFKLRYAPSSTEVADVSRMLQKGASGADRKGKTVMVHEHHGAHRSQSHERKENMTEEQNDDIPMEIVELMAKNQYERCLHMCLSYVVLDVLKCITCLCLHNSFLPSIYIRRAEELIAIEIKHTLLSI